MKADQDEPICIKCGLWESLHGARHSCPSLDSDRLDWLVENVATIRPRSVGDADDWWEVECWEYGPPDVAPRRVSYPGADLRAAIDAAMQSALAFPPSGRPNQP